MFLYSFVAATLSTPFIPFIPFRWIFFRSYFGNVASLLPILLSSESRTTCNNFLNQSDNSTKKKKSSTWKETKNKIGINSKPFHSTNNICRATKKKKKKNSAMPKKYGVTLAIDLAYKFATFNGMEIDFAGIGKHGILPNKTKTFWQRRKYRFFFLSLNMISMGSNRLFFFFCYIFLRRVVTSIGSLEI